MQTEPVITEPQIVPEAFGAIPEAAMTSRVLVVEDDPDMRRLVGAVLRGDGHDVVEVDSGVDLLDWMELTMWGPKHQTFDAVVSDIKLPDLTAIEVLAAVRCRPWRTPVVLLTAFDDPQVHAEAYALGALAVLTKPLDLDHFRAMVRGITSCRDGTLGTLRYHA